MVEGFGFLDRWPRGPPEWIRSERGLVRAHTRGTPRVVARGSALRLAGVTALAAGLGSRRGPRVVAAALGGAAALAATGVAPTAAGAGGAGDLGGGVLERRPDLV